MRDFVFSPRYALSDIRNPDKDTLSDLILNANQPGREYGEASIKFDDGNPKIWLYILHDNALGCSLWYHDADGESWVPIGDAERMNELVRPDDINSPAGSFLESSVALAAIEEFCRSGERFAGVAWTRIRDLQIPDEAWEET